MPRTVSRRRAGGRHGRLAPDRGELAEHHLRAAHGVGLQGSGSCSSASVPGSGSTRLDARRRAVVSSEAVGSGAKSFGCSGPCHGVDVAQERRGAAARQRVDRRVVQRALGRARHRRVGRDAERRRTRTASPACAARSRSAREPVGQEGRDQGRRERQARDLHRRGSATMAQGRQHASRRPRRRPCPASTVRAVVARRSPSDIAISCVDHRRARSTRSIAVAAVRVGRQRGSAATSAPSEPSGAIEASKRRVGRAGPAGFKAGGAVISAHHDSCTGCLGRAHDVHDRGVDGGDRGTAGAHVDLRRIDERVRRHDRAHDRGEVERRR